MNNLCFLLWLGYFVKGSFTEKDYETQAPAEKTAEYHYVVSEAVPIHVDCNLSSSNIDFLQQQTQAIKSETWIILYLLGRCIIGVIFIP